jgi:hypothetical protein
LKHRVEIDDTIHIGERHAQRMGHYCHNWFGEAAINLLCGM